MVGLRGLKRPRTDLTLMHMLAPTVLPTMLSLVVQAALEEEVQAAMED